MKENCVYLSELKTNNKMIKKNIKKDCHFAEKDVEI